MKTINGYKVITLILAIGSFSVNQSNAGPGYVCSGATVPTLAENGSCKNGTPIPTYYANSSPSLRKFVDSLPGITPAGANVFSNSKIPGSYIPVAVGDTKSYPGSVYYELAVIEYSQQMHSDLPKATTLRGYVQIDRDKTNVQTINGTSSEQLALKYPDGSPIYLPQEKGLVNGVWDHTLVLDNNGNPVLVPAIAKEKPHYFGPLIVAKKGVATRVKFNNLLPKGAAILEKGEVNRRGDLFLPVDETLPGAGNSTVPLATYPQNRTSFHLHGGDSPWISDGTPHQWITPETSNKIDPVLRRGNRTVNVPDMPYPGDMAQTVYWPNDQSERFMWYHDHSFGLTRQNAYIGEAAPYFIQDPAEDTALASAMPKDVLPIVLQDKTFVASDINIQDSKWDQAYWGKPGDLWYPHVYEPNVIDKDYKTGSTLNTVVNNDAGRWDYGPTADPTAPYTSILPLPTGEYGHASVGPEAYMDTPLVNGVAYPTVTVQPKAYRVRFLNAANDRYFNLSLWQADGSVKSKDGRSNTEVKLIPELIPSKIGIIKEGKNYKAPKVTISDKTGYGAGATATATTINGLIKSITITNSGSNYANPVVTITDSNGIGASVNLETVAGRPSGIPDPTTAGPNVIVFSTEGGLIPSPVVFKPTTMSFDINGSETGGGLYFAPAERAEAVIDFSNYAGKTLILYNDSSAPVPDGDSRYDYYTDNPDQRYIGGAATTLAGYGPNTRTIMQIVVANANPAPVYDPKGNGGALATLLPKVYASIADAHIDNSIVADGKLTSQTLDQWKASHSSVDLKTKTIEGGFDVNFGRLIANFGIELPGFGAPTPLSYIDKATDVVEDGKIQYWLIKNNDADNHPIHTHLFNVQVIARVDHATGLLINPYPHEAGWKEDLQNWPLQDTIVALKPKTPLLPFGLPDSVRLMDPTMNSGDATNTSLDQNYIANDIPKASIPLAFQQYDLTTGQQASVSNDIQNFGWEYVYHCHILGHEENDLMRPMVFHPKTVVKPAAPSRLAVDVKGNLTWVDATLISNLASTKGNPANEIGFRVEYSTNNGNSYLPASTNIGANNFITIPINTGLLNPSPSGVKINSTANTGLFNVSYLKTGTTYLLRVVAVNQAGETPSAPVEYTK